VRGERLAADQQRARTALAAKHQERRLICEKHVDFSENLGATPARGCWASRCTR